MTDCNADELIGRCTTDPDDKGSLREYGQVSLVFGNDGKLTYIIHGEKKDEIMVLTYRLEDGMLVTDQPSAPREERSAITLTPEGKLVLEIRRRSISVHTNSIRLNKNQSLSNTLGVSAVERSHLPSALRNMQTDLAKL